MSESARTAPTKRHLIPVLLAVALLVAGLAAPALAKATTTEVSATLTLAAPPEAEREWVSGPILHLRRTALTWGLDGDLSGTVDVLHNTNLNLTTGQGTGFGSMTIATDDVTWEGRYRGTYTDELFAGTFVVHGDDGTVMRGAVAVTELEPVPTADLEGVILERPGR